MRPGSLVKRSVLVAALVVSGCTAEVPVDEYDTANQPLTGCALYGVIVANCGASFLSLLASGGFTAAAGNTCWLATCAFSLCEIKEAHDQCVADMSAPRDRPGPITGHEGGDCWEPYDPAADCRDICGARTPDRAGSCADYWGIDAVPGSHLAHLQHQCDVCLNDCVERTNEACTDDEDDEDDDAADDGTDMMLEDNATGPGGSGPGAGSGPTSPSPSQVCIDPPPCMVGSGSGSGSMCGGGVC